MFRGIGAEYRPRRSILISDLNVHFEYSEDNYGINMTCSIESVRVEAARTA